MRGPVTYQLVGGPRNEKPDRWEAGRALERWGARGAVLPAHLNCEMNVPSPLRQMIAMGTRGAPATSLPEIATFSRGINVKYSPLFAYGSFSAALVAAAAWAGFWGWVLRRAVASGLA